MFAVLLLASLQEGVRLPGSLIGAQEEIGQGEGIIECLSRRLEARSRVGVLDLDAPRCPHGLHCEPTGPARGSVLVPGDATVPDKAPKLRKDVALDGSQVRRGPIRRLLSKLNPFHRKLRSGDDSKDVNRPSPKRAD